MAIESVQALTLIDRSKIDYRDMSVDFPLYAVRELGGDLDRVLTPAIKASEPGTASCFSARSERSHSLTLRDCALLELYSSYGLGYMDRWNGHYEPATRLAELSVLLADHIDAEGTYVIDDFHVCTLPEVWFYTERRTGDLSTTGCIGLGARLRDTPRWSHGLLVFAAELHDETLGLRLASLATAASQMNRPRVISVRDRRIVLIIGGSTTQGEPARETIESLSRYETLASVLLEANPT
jgi:hypothetical protein